MACHHQRSPARHCSITDGVSGMVACSWRRSAARAERSSLRRLQAQAAVWSNEDVDLIAFLQPGLTQAIGREPDRQAVPPAADRLREVLAGVS